MSKFYTYIIPIFFFAIVSYISIIIFNNEAFVFAGLIISLIWINRIGVKFDNKIVKIITLSLLVLFILWAVLMLFVARGWSSG